MRLTSMTLCAVLAIGCGDNGGGETTAGSESSTGGTASTSGAGPTSEGTSSSGELPTTGGGNSSGGTGTGSETGDESSGESGSSEGTGTTGGGLDCEALSVTPLVPTKVFTGYEGSEDLAFDGKGGLALKRDGNVVIVRADLSETTLAMGVPPAYGTRFLADGRLLVALPQAGKVIAVVGPASAADSALDAVVAQGIDARRAAADPRDLPTLPLAAIPGWDRRNTDAEFIASAPCFRPRPAGRVYAPPLVLGEPERR